MPLHTLLGNSCEQISKVTLSFTSMRTMTEKMLLSVYSMLTHVRSHTHTPDFRPNSKQQILKQTAHKYGWTDETEIFIAVVRQPFFECVERFRKKVNTVDVEEIGRIQKQRQQ